MPALKAEQTASSLPPPFSARYDLFKKGLPVATTDYRLSYQQNRARFSSHTSLSGIAAWLSDDELNEQSELAVKSQQLILEKYRLSQSGDAPREVRTEITDSQARTSATEQPVITTTLELPVWDKLSVLLAIMQHAKKEHAVSPPEAITLNLLDEGRLKAYQLSFLGHKELEVYDDEWINTAIWQARQINQTTDTTSRKLLAYIAPDYRFLPIKIEQYKNSQLHATLKLDEVKWQ